MLSLTLTVAQADLLLEAMLHRKEVYQNISVPDSDKGYFVALAAEIQGIVDAIKVARCRALLAK